MRPKRSITYMDDAAIAARVVAGDVDAYRHIIEKYQAPLVRYAIVIVHDADTADDVAQETFIRAYQGLRGYNPRYAFSSWIYRIAHNVAIDTIRTHKDLQIESEDTIAIDDTTAQRLDKEFTAKHVSKCLASLPVKYREPIGLYYLEHKTYAEIGDILHISTSVVGVRVNRAKQKLRSICKELGVRS